MHPAVASRLLWAAFAALPACSHRPSAAPTETIRPEVVLRAPGKGEVRVRVEVARTPAEHARGLMFRDHLDEGSGMLFIFDAPSHREFWMRNTYIPLDMLFIGADKRVVGVIEKTTPLTDDLRSVPAESQYVLEVPGGFAARHGLGAGTAMQFTD